MSTCTIRPRTASDATVAGAAGDVAENLGLGLTYQDYPGFHQMKAEGSAAIHDVALVPAILSLTGQITGCGAASMLSTWPADKDTRST